MRFDTYQTEAFHDEIFDETGAARPEARLLLDTIRSVAAAPQLAHYARPSFPPGRPLAEAVGELSHRIHSEFRYEPKSTSIEMPLLHVFENRRGVCQDFAHVMIGTLRSQHLAARYVSGYLRSGATYQGGGRLACLGVRVCSRRRMAGFRPDE